MTFPKRKPKYKNRKVEVDGIKFDSKKEAKRYGELKLLEKAGEISDLQCHPKFDLVINGQKILITSDRYKNGRQAKYSPDFRYTCQKGGGFIAEDVKGGRATKTEAYKLRAAIFKVAYPHITLLEV